VLDGHGWARQGSFGRSRRARKSRRAEGEAREHSWTPDLGMKLRRWGEGQARSELGTRPWQRALGWEHRGMSREDACRRAPWPDLVGARRAQRELGRELGLGTGLTAGEIERARRQKLDARHGNPAEQSTELRGRRAGWACGQERDFGWASDRKLWPWMG
jgi:hypothetical protein